MVAPDQAVRHPKKMTAGTLQSRTDGEMQPIRHHQHEKMTAGAPNLSKMMTGGNLLAPARGEMKTIGRDQPALLPILVADGEKSLVETKAILAGGGAVTIAEAQKNRGKTMHDRARTAFLQKMMTTNGVDLLPFHGNEEIIIVDHDHLVHRAQEEENHGVALSEKVTGEIEALTHGEIKKKVERMDGALHKTTPNVLVLLKLRPLAGETQLTPATRDLADGVQPPNRKTPDGETQVL